MCLNPSKVSDVGFVACRKCWQCRERKVDDWVGRNIAESKTAKAGHVVTLTYGRDLRLGTIDNLRAAVLTYSDVQKMLKHLRADGYPVRYFAVGEYGSKKGRAHWHIILYWQDNVPDVDLRKNIHWKYWQHGWSYWDKMTPEAVRYACKYLVKSTDDEAAQAFGPMPSKKPPLGDAYFRDLARQHVDAGLALQSLFYSFPDIRRVPKGTATKTVKSFREAFRPVQFHMTGKTADNFIRHYVECLTGAPMPIKPGLGCGKAALLEYEGLLWEWILLALSPSVRMPSSELVEDWLDALARPLNEAAQYRAVYQEQIRAKYNNPAYGAGFNLWRKESEQWQKNREGETKEVRREREIREGIRY